MAGWIGGRGIGPAVCTNFLNGLDPARLRCKTIETDVCASLD